MAANPEFAADRETLFADQDDDLARAFLATQAASPGPDAWAAALDRVAPAPGPPPRRRAPLEPPGHRRRGGGGCRGGRPDRPGYPAADTSPTRRTGLPR